MAVKGRALIFGFIKKTKKSRFFFHIQSNVFFFPLHILFRFSSGIPHLSQNSCVIVLNTLPTVSVDHMIVRLVNDNVVNALIMWFPANEVTALPELKRLLFEVHKTSSKKFQRFFNAMWYFPNCNSWVIDRDARFTGRAHDSRLFLRFASVGMWSGRSRLLCFVFDAVGFIGRNWCEGRSLKSASGCAVVASCKQVYLLSPYLETRPQQA